MHFLMKDVCINFDVHKYHMYVLDSVWFILLINNYIFV